MFPNWLSQISWLEEWSDDQILQYFFSKRLDVMIFIWKSIQNIKLDAAIFNHLSDFALDVGGHTVWFKENWYQKLDEKLNRVSAPLHYNLLLWFDSSKKIIMKIYLSLNILKTNFYLLYLMFAFPQPELLCMIPKPHLW